jgi:hypothetical protein
MTTIYLHIGTPKTGTTALQKFLFDNREKLLEKGYLYPISGIISTAQNSKRSPQHLGLCEALVKHYDIKYPVDTNSRDKCERSWEELKREINTINPKTVIISSEFFTAMQEYYNPDIIALVKKRLEDYETKIVLYVRRQDDFFRSSYCQYMKSPLPNKVPNHFLQANYIHKEILEISEFILSVKFQANYYSTLELWKKAFGINNIIVRPFEREQMKNGSVINDFFEVINLKYEESQLKLKNSINISQSEKVIKIINLIEKISQIRRLSKEKYWYLYKKIPFVRMDSRIQLAMFLSHLIPDFLISDKLLSAEDRANIMKEFEESNQKVAKEYLDREDGRLFYSTQ